MDTDALELVGQIAELDEKHSDDFNWKADQIFTKIKDLSDFDSQEQLLALLVVQAPGHMCRELIFSICMYALHACLDQPVKASISLTGDARLTREAIYRAVEAGRYRFGGELLDLYGRTVRTLAA